jgi:selenocysteine-specific elongation factor
MHVLATAGHVDHGKSTLVRALTGINPDRLREEQQREMTIDLGFAWMNLPDGDPVGIIDVPGHIDFIDNMLAGVGGIDAALLIIAADEGPMPQTLEHLAILNLLQVARGVVALTKTDLAPDADWVTLVSADIRALLAQTPLADAPIVPVSARAGDGLTNLVATLARVLGQSPPRPNVGKARLSVDRAFTVQGFGTVVTGTLLDGALGIGDEVAVVTQHGEMLPARVRGLQTHKHKLDRAQPGSRVAINLTGVDVAQVARGSVVTTPGTLAPTTLMDVRIELLNDHLAMRKNVALRHNAEVKVFSGAAQSLARVWLLDADLLQPGQEGWAQLQLATPMPLGNGDRFILRIPSPSMTVGGGSVIDAHPNRRYRRKGGRADASVIQRLEALSLGTPADRLANALRELQFATREEAMRAAQLNAAEMTEALLNTDRYIASQNILANRDVWQGAHLQAVQLLRAFHTEQPLQEGMPRDTLRSRLKLAPNVFGALLALVPDRDADSHELLADEGDVVRLASHRVQFSPQQQRAVDVLLAQCAAQPWATASVKEVRIAVGDGVYEVLLRRKQLVQLGSDVIVLPQTYDAAVRDVRAFIQREGQMTAAQVRDLFGTTRKYALGLMEHLDAVGVTRRVGDARVLK